MVMSKRSTAFAIPVIGLLALAFVSGIPRIVQGADEIDLSGEWVIDLEHSDEPHEVVHSAMDRRSGLGRVRAGVSIFGIPVQDMIDIASDGDTPKPREEEHRENVHRHVTDKIDALDIVQSDDTVRVDYDGIHTYRYRDGATMSDGDATIRADWRGDAYVVERETPGKAKVTEEFRIDHNTSRLTWIVSTKLESGKSVKIRRVYDRASSP